MTRRAAIAGGLALTLVAIGLPLIAADLLLKALQLPRSSSRTLLLSGSSLHSSPQGYRLYDSNRNIETTAVYGDTIAYRFAAGSNNLGLISATTVGPNQAIDLAIVGDSFAEGQGGHAWVSDLQRTLLLPQSVSSLNYAVGGSGFEDFAVAARDARQRHQARRLLVLFIEHDAYRPYQTMGSNAQCSFYSNGALDHLPAPLVCSIYGVVWHHVAPGLSDQQLIVESRKHQNYGVLPALNQLLQQRQRPPRNKQAQPQASPTGLRFGPLPPAAMGAMQRIKALYGSANVLLVQLPDRAGPQTSASFAETLQSSTGLTVRNLAATCPLKREQFHRLDNHPNSSGYRRLQQCVTSDPLIRRFVLQQPKP